MSTRTLVLEVDADFSDAWWEEEATPRERTHLLRFALSLPRTTTDETLATVCREAVLSAVGDGGECAALRKQCDEWRDKAREAERARDAERARADGLEARQEDGLQLAVRRAAEEATRTSEASLAALREAHAQLGQDKVVAERELTAQVREQLSEVVKATQECAALRAEVARLKTPAERGRVGEFAVAEALSDVGFEVEDTSTGARKEEGYLDLLVRPLAQPDLRVAVEVKNRAAIDPSKDLKTFESKTREGLAKGLFDTSVFVSVRAPTKRGAHALELFEDADGRGTVPVSFVGPERGRGAPPLSEEALQGHLLLHVAFVAKCQTLRGLLALQTAPHDDEAAARVRSLVDGVAEDLAATLEDMNAQSKAIASLQQVARSVRVRAVQLLTRLCDARRTVAWLGGGGSGGGDPAWMAEFRLARDKVQAGATDAVVWKNLSDAQKKRVADHLGGRETFFKAARGERGVETRDEGEGE